MSIEIKKRSEWFDVAKGIALFSVVCAHTYPISSEVWYIASLSKLLGLFGTFGVPIFFFCSGLFSETEKFSFKKLINKAKYVGVPWLLIGTMVYLYVALRKETIPYVDFFFGNGSYLYYLSMYMIFLLYCYFVHSKRIDLLLLIFSLIFNIVVEFFMTVDLNLYINPLFWMCWFLLGRLVKRKVGIPVSIKLRKLEKIFCYVLCVLACAAGVFLIDGEPIYWREGAIFIEGIILLGTLILSYELKGVKLLQWMGMNSLAVYLCHMPIAGIVVHFTQNIGVFFILRPVVTLAITCSALYVYSVVVMKVFNRPMLLWIFGLKRRNG